MLSFINISGGFLVSGKMLGLFKCPNDPKDFFELYSVPVGLILGSLAFSVYVVISTFYITYLVSCGVSRITLTRSMKNRDVSQIFLVVLNRISNMLHIAAIAELVKTSKQLILATN